MGNVGMRELLPHFDSECKVKGVTATFWPRI